MKMRRYLSTDVRPIQTLALILSLLCLAPSSARSAGALSPGARVAIIGDSITEQKLYSLYMEAYLLACSGVPDLKVFQFGWGGETAAGFAARLDNDLAAFRPTVATTCYGMNDGSYRPYTADIGKNYETNMLKVVERLRQAGVGQIVVGSPGAVDTRYFVRDNFKPLSGADGYNQNLGKLRDIGRQIATERGTLFADVHQPMLDAAIKAKQALGNDYDVCGKDGFHPGTNGHLIMAYAFLKALGCDGDLGSIVFDLDGPVRVSGAGHQMVGGGAGKVEISSTRYPFCFSGDEKSSEGTRSIAPFFPFNEDLNRLTLKVLNLREARARVTWGDESREFSREQLAAGVNLAASFTRTPFAEPFQRLMQAVRAKQDFETQMIKGMVTNFRQFNQQTRRDLELAAAFNQLRDRLAGEQQRLHDAARRTIQPVQHTLTVTPLP